MSFDPRFGAAALRQSFFDYFVKHGHAVVRSSSLVPANDPTLLFTNAGMNQFKDLFLGKESRAYTRAASAQKCVRAGGKHNDLENVGYTPRHHTFFEMLGNFSFGDYFKRDAIPFAWNLLTKEWGLDPSRLHATVFEGGEGLPADDEAYEIWHQTVGIPKERLWRLSAKDNFWEMGETGPCGPCSEIHYERPEKVACEAEQSGGKCLGPACDCDRFMEIWNLVFMQFYRGEDRKLTPLPKPNIDTGMGLERVAQLLQGVKSNYDIDLFQKIIAAAAELAKNAYGKNPQHDTALRVVADHLRASTFLIADGIVPSNEGRGYVLRKIMRRAIRYGRDLGLREPFMFKLVHVLVEEMGAAYPELRENEKSISDTIAREEATFVKTVELGLVQFWYMINRVKPEDHNMMIPGDELFRLYDSFGFPLDWAEELAREHKFVIDYPGFNAAMDKQKSLARASWKGEDKAGAFEFLKRPGAPRIDASEFLGYTDLEVGAATVTALVVDEKPVSSLKAGQSGWVFLDKTPFYAESGGQVGDTGHLSGEWGTAQVTDTKKPLPGLVAHAVKVVEGELQRGASARLSVDAKTRRGSVSHHDATHLLHAALRKLLGNHVKQAGSLVAPGHLRFDFSHYAQVDALLLREIEQLVNEQIMANHKVESFVDVPIEQALKMGAIALFGEKYGDKVRVVRMSDFSVEFCGGTHGNFTGEIGPFKIAGERAVSAGVRRIEAAAGAAALARIQHEHEALRATAAALNAPEDQLLSRIEQLREEAKQLQKQVSDLKRKAALAGGGGAGVANEAGDGIGAIHGVKYLTRAVADLESGEAKQLADEFRGLVKSGVVVLGVTKGDKCSLLVALTPDMTDKLDAGKIVRELAKIIGGGGGGKRELAEAGGKLPEKIPAALAAVPETLGKLLGG